MMKYSGVKTDEKHRFLKCPVCGNSEFSGEAEFCKICGSAIYNYCQDLYDESGYRISTGCGKPNPGDSRFCEYCGNPTLLFKYLTHWEDEKVHLEKYGASEDDDLGYNDIEDDSFEITDKSINHESSSSKPTSSFEIIDETPEFEVHDDFEIVDQEFQQVETDSFEIEDDLSDKKTEISDDLSDQFSQFIDDEFEDKKK